MKKLCVQTRERVIDIELIHIITDIYYNFALTHFYDNNVYYRAKSLAPRVIIINY